LEWASPHKNLGTNQGGQAGKARDKSPLFFVFSKKQVGGGTRGLKGEAGTGRGENFDPKEGVSGSAATRREGRDGAQGKKGGKEGSWDDKKPLCSQRGTNYSFSR